MNHDHNDDDDGHKEYNDDEGIMIMLISMISMRIKKIMMILMTQTACMQT
jgi:hypothetical protein